MPLLDSTECTLLLLNARSDLADQLDSRLSRCYTLIHAAALAAAVPLYIATRDDRASSEQPSPCASGPNACYSYPSGTIRALWAERGLAQAIANHRRSSLVLAGSWLETDITIVTLSALADGFDTHLLFDASPSQHIENRQIAIDRILQAGAVPLSTPQMVHEWAERSSDNTRRRALLDLLGPDTAARIGADL